MSIDPRQLPLDPGFDGSSVRGEPLGPEQLSPAAVRRRFSNPGPWTPELRSDPRLQSESAEASKPAAVLIPLVLRDDRFSVLLTHRAAHLQAHAGQISFPGGRIEPSDRGPVEAALREASEETGLAIERIELLAARCSIWRARWSESSRLRSPCALTPARWKTRSRCRFRS